MLAGPGPEVSSIIRADANPTNASSVAFTVTFDEDVNGVDTSDFVVDANGPTLASVDSVSGTGAVYTINVFTGSGDGSLSIDLIDNDSIVRVSGNGKPLGGNGTTGNQDGSFTTGEIYTIDKTAPIVDSITLIGTPTASAATIEYNVTFSEAVEGVDLTDFTLITSGVVGAGIASVDGSGTSYVVEVSTGGGQGTVQLALNDNDTIADLASNPLGGVGVGTQQTGPVHQVENSPPSVVSITSEQSTPTNADLIDFTVVFDKSVQNVGLNDFTLTIGGDITNAMLTNVVGSTDTYTVTVSTGDGDGTIQLGIADPPTITDLSGNALPTTSLTSSVITIDKTAPASFGASALDLSPTNLQQVRYRIKFDEPVIGVSTDNLQPFILDSEPADPISGVFVAEVTGSGDTYDVLLNTGTGSGAVALRLVNDGNFSDLAGNSPNVVGGSGRVYQIDRIAPTVESVVLEDASPTNESPLSFLITLSESVTSFGLGDVTLDQTGLPNALLASLQTISGTQKRVFVTPGVGDGTLSIDVTPRTSATDYAGNQLATPANNFDAYVVDTLAPEVDSITLVGPSTTSASSIDFDVVFNEPVGNVTASDFGMVGTGISGASIANIVGSGAEYTVTVSAGTFDGTIGLNAVTGGTAIDDLSNPLGSGFTGPVATIDRTAPSVLSVSAPVSITNSSTIDYTVQFSETVTGFTASDLTLVSGGAITSASINPVSGSGDTYTVTVNTGSGDGTIGLDVNASASIVDAAGTSLAAGLIGDVVSIDKTAPAITTFASATSLLTNTDNLLFDVVFSEPITSFDVNDLTLTTTGLVGASIAQISGSGTDYSVRVATGTGDGTARLALANTPTISDLAGNPLPASATQSELVTIDKTTPTTMSIGRLSPADVTLTNATTVQYEVVFPEPVTGITPSVFYPHTNQTGNLRDLTVSSVIGSGDTYTVTINIGGGQGPLLLGIDNPSGLIRDLAGNSISYIQGAGVNYVVDLIAPEVESITRASVSPTSSQSLEFNVLFNESVLNVDPGDFELAVNGVTDAMINSVSGTGASYVVTVTHTGGNGTLGLNYKAASSVNDAAGNLVNGGFTTGEVYTIATASFSIAAADAAKNEGNSEPTPFTFTVTRSDDTTGTASVDYTVSGSGTDAADAGDFGGAFPSGTVTFADGEATKVITIDVLGDSNVEPDEGFSVTLSNPSSPAVISSGTADGNIVNDDLVQTFAPVVTLPSSAVTFVEGDGPLLVDPSATVVDTDSPDFDGAVLTLEITNNASVDDQLLINNQGTGPGQVGVSANVISYEGAAIATFSGGAGTTPLVITFASGSTPDAAQAILRNAQYANASDTPSTLPRLITATLVDGDGNQSAATSTEVAFDFAFAVSSTEFSSIQGVGRDAAGNLYVGGRFTGTADVDPGPSEVLLTSTGGSQDAYIASYTSAGVLRWVQQFGDTGSDDVLDIEVTASGNVFAVGAFAGTVVFDSGAGNATFVADGPRDNYLLKFDSDGGLVASGSFGGDTSDIALDPDGNLLLTGSYARTVDIDPSPGTFFLPDAGSTGNGNSFYLKLNPNLEFVWAKSIEQVGGTFQVGDRGTAIATDSSGNVYALGEYRANFDFDFGPGTFQLSTSSDTNPDIYLLKLTSMGDFVWAKSWGSTEFDVGHALAVDNNDNIVVAGVFGGTNVGGTTASADFDPGPGTDIQTSVGVYDMFVSKFDSDGTFQWARTAGSTANESAGTIATDSLGNIVAGVSFYRAIDFDPSVNVFEIDPVGSASGFWGLSPDGDFRFASHLAPESSSAYNGLAALTIDQNDYLLAAGHFSGGTDFDPGGGTFLIPASSDGSFFLGLDVVGLPANQTVNVIAIDSEFAITATDASKNEGESGSSRFTFTVTRSVDTEGPASIDYFVTGSGANQANASDFGGNFPSGTVEFADGETQQLITVDVSADSIVETDEVFTVTISNPSVPATITTETAEGTILNDDVAGFEIVEPGEIIAWSGSGETGADPFGVPFVSSDTTTFPSWGMPGFGTGVTTFQAPGSFDGFRVSFSGLPSDVTINESHGNTGLNVDPFSVDDRWNKEVTGNSILFTSPDPATKRLDQGDRMFVSVIFTGDLDPSLLQFDVEYLDSTNPVGTVVSETGASDTFTVALTAEPESDVVIDVTSGDIGEATVDQPTLTFTNQNWFVAQTVTVTGIDDALVDDDQTTSITISVNDQASDDSFGSLPDQVVSVTTIDDEIPTVVSMDVAPMLIAEDGVEDMVYTLSRTGDTSTSLAVNFTISGTANSTSDFTISHAGTVNFSAGSSTATVTVSATSDSTPEGNETVILTIDPNSAYVVGSAGSATGTILDNDEPGVGQLVGIDLGTNSTLEHSPTNWNQAFFLNFSLTDLLAEDGQPTGIDLVSQFSSGGGISNFIPNPLTLPAHTQSLVKIDEVSVGNAGVPYSATFSGLEAGASYRVYVLAYTGTSGNGNTQNVTISGESGSEVSFTQTLTSQNVYVNGSKGSSLETLESYAEVVTASSTGDISVNITPNAGDNIHVAALAIQQISGATDPLSVTIAPASISENGGSATVTITRGTDTTNSLDVVITNSDPSEASVPLTATIPAGQSSVDVTLNALNDTAVDGTQTVTITASVAGGIADGMSGLDDSFGTFGKANTQLDSQYQPPHGVIASLPDGKILAASEASTEFELTIQRFNADGSSDTTFGTGGVVVPTVASGVGSFDPTEPFPKSIEVAPDGKFYIGGVLANGAETPFLARFNSDGSLDSSFGIGGIADLTSVGLVSIEGMDLTDDGKLLVALSSNNSSLFRAMRINPDGQLDASFGISGVAGFPNVFSEAIDVATLPNGKFLLLGEDGRMIRGDQFGNVDPMFGNEGEAFVPFSSATKVFTDLLVDGAGNIVIAGTATESFADDFTLARFSSDGLLDPSFDSDGLVTLDVAGADDIATSLEIGIDGKLFVVGYTTPAGGNQAAVVRLNSDGSPDNTFDGDGRLVTTLGSNSSQQTLGSAMTPDASLLVLGGNLSDIQIAKISSGVVPFSGSSGVYVTDDDASNLDFGDAPIGYPVSISDSGASHDVTAGGPFLGFLADAEIDGVNSAGAKFDDENGSDDEDGVFFTSGVVFAAADASLTGTVVVELQNADPLSNRLDAWIDFNRDGDWADPGEQIFASFDLGTSDGGHVLSFAVPQDTGDNVISGNTYARFRVSTLGGLGVTGTAADGEVEDHQLTIVSAAPLIVDTLTDESDGDFSPGDLSLREAIELANFKAGADTIEFAPALSGGTITLTVDQLEVTDDLTITGPGSSNMTIDGGDAFRVFQSLNVGAFELQGLTITGGRPSYTSSSNSGGAIFSSGDLMLTDVVITGNVAGGSLGDGGGIMHSNGDVTITDSVISNNTTTTSSALGGGIHSLGSTVLIQNSVVDGNTMTGDSSVGAGVVVINGNLTLTQSTISNNTSSADTVTGGGVTVGGGNLTILASTISGNSVTGSGGGVAFDGLGFTATVTNSTVSGNSAGVYGGGIANFAGSFDINHSTVTNNSAPADNGGGVASFTSSQASAIVTTIYSSIISGNSSSDVDQIVFAGPAAPLDSVFSDGFNVVGNGTAVPDRFTGPSDQTLIANPGLNPLANNGGPTLTHALQASSPALDAGEMTSTENLDQRGTGFPRLSGSNVDVGAFERDATTLPRFSIRATDATKLEGDTGLTTFTFTVTRSGDTSGSASVDYQVSGDGAYAADANDFTGVLPGGTLAFDDGQESILINIDVTGDVLAEADEDFRVTLSNASASTLIDVATADGTILTDETPELTVDISATSIPENGGSTTATVTRNTDTTDELIVSLAASDASEVTLPQTVIIPAGQTTSAPFVIDGIDDAVVDGTQTVTITASTSTASSLAQQYVDDFSGPTIDSFWNVSAAIPDSTITQVDGVLRIHSPTAPSTFTDSKVESATIFSGSDFEASVDFRVPDGNAMAWLTLGRRPQGQGTPQTYGLYLYRAANYFTWLANDSFTGSMSARSGFGDERTQWHQLKLQYNAETMTATSFVDGVEVNSDSVNLDHAVVILNMKDRDSEGLGPSTIEFDNFQFSYGQTIAAGSANIDVTDDDVAELSLSIVDTEIAENGGQTTATVSRNTDTTNPLTVTIATSDNGEARVPLSVTIPAGQSVSDPFTITGVDDQIVDGTQTVTITATASGHSGTDGTVDVTDDDTSPTVLIDLVDTLLFDGDDASNVTFTFSAATTDFDASDVVVTNGTISNFDGTGTTYSATFTAADGFDGIGTVSVNAGSYSDAFGNAGLAGSDSVAIDTLNPEVVVEIVDTLLDESDNSSVVTFTFSENVNDFIGADVVVSNGTLSDFSGSGMNYTATFTADPTVDGIGTAAVSVGSFTDAAGNFGTGGSDTVVLERPPQAPEDILLDTDSINENLDTSAADLLFANLSAVDPDIDDAHSYELVSGEGDSDNARFQITEDQLFLRQGEVLDYETQASYSVRMRVTDGAGLVFEKSVTLDVNNLVEVTKEDITVGDGTAQRSRVESLTIQFDAEVTIDPEAFTVIKRGTDGGNVDVAYTTRLDQNGHTIADLTFSGSFVEYGSLVDGNYQLTIVGTKIATSRAYGIDADRDGLADDNILFGDNESDVFFRLYGDTNGDGLVGAADYIALRNSYGTSDSDPGHERSLDFDSDGIIGASDFFAFRNNYGSARNY
ncbi:Ig-like domain-containing protein [Rhodopirellula halodulae]|uniref:Ig-like domain-containing protein n=1 Tax=Rhodopirellula halodulae TaxID=2894198 RepID=UPI001E284AF7|nr:Ig-like domain-containing protein [Rhodopirellula sp. JC737]MCC9655500.1 Ig-like domain-containing protein [Rhodopirellula sp. JC737]